MREVKDWIALSDRNRTVEYMNACRRVAFSEALQLLSSSFRSVGVKDLIVVGEGDGSRLLITISR